MFFVKIDIHVLFLYCFVCYYVYITLLSLLFLCEFLWKGVDVLLLMNNVADTIIRLLGEPKRFAYKAEPMTLYLKNNETERIELVKAYNVDFEIACDLFDIQDARSNDCLYNPHIINIVEPGLDGDENDAYVSHSTILDEASFKKLQAYSNTNGKLKSYSGVVEGYAVQDIKRLFNRNDIVDTGVCLTDSIISIHGLRYPDTPFDENRHKRFVQASESHIAKLKRQKKFQLAVANMYQPSVYKLDYDNIYEYC